MPAERRRPGQGSRVSEDDSTFTWPTTQPTQPTHEPAEYHHVFFNGRKYEKTRVERRRNFEGWIRPVTEGGPAHEANLNRVVICKDCLIVPANITSEDRDGDLVCADCGLVLDKIVSTESEWRSFANDENGVDKCRVGGGESVLFGDSKLELQTSIGPGQNDMARALERAQKNLSGKDGRKAASLAGGFSDIAAFCAKGGFPDSAKEVAQQVYKIFMDEPKRKNFPYAALLGACLVLGCRQAKFGRGFKEICLLCKCTIKEIGRAYKAVVDIIQAHEAKIQEKRAQNIHVNNTIGAYNAEQNSTSALDLIVRMTERLGLPMKVKILADQIASEEEKTIACLAGRRPSTVAASSLLMAIKFMKIDKTTIQVAEVAKISPHTLTKTYKLLNSYADKLIDAKWAKDGSGDFANLKKSDD
ncbi:hypothetical protein BJ508DRAFT_231710 [Ascobolus immersus RN42]|uniref:General transcription factor TFIIB n=1 Tax=Ascobolus immersus RN42 TaxID=1160509 RepID=A0A3N4HDU6_ASCIM|nr:hypothetical protein BJ508DRAFT_231710 [Ascobolus immersus RN42]